MSDEILVKGPTVKVTDLSEGARERAVKHLRILATHIEQGGEVVSGGLAMSETSPGAYKLDSDIVIREPVGEYCETCGRWVSGFKYEGCCSGRECGCGGRPIEPCVCSEECWNKLLEKNK